MKNRTLAKKGALTRGMLWLLTALLLLTSMLTVFALAGTESGMRGDVNFDGTVDAKDYMAVKRHVLGTYTLTAAQRSAADMDGDGTVHAKDYMIIKRIALGTYQADSEEPVLTPDSRSDTDLSVWNPSEDAESVTVSAGESSDSNSSVSSEEEPTWAEEILQLVNTERAKAGLPALILSEQLTGVANLKAQDMADNHYFDHTSPTYGTPFEMMRTYGISYRSAGENIAAGQRTPEEVMNAWMNSSGHKANILNESYTTLGVGIATGGDYGIYWVQMFTS